ncbi:hypothetical protein FBU30_002434 [Linnemannia zychae]|nr:hypothetical protein FBU30_002434 [Linnemannia zychae]
MVYLALQGMMTAPKALKTLNLSSSSLSTTSTFSNFTSPASTPASSTTSLPLSSPKLKPDPYSPNSIKLETIEPPTYGSSRALIPDNNAKKIPRPPNSFIIYRREHSSNYTKITAAELSKILGEQWANEPPQRKAYYAELAKAAEKEHALKYPEYKFTPAKRGTGRRAKTIRAAVNATMKVTPTTATSSKISSTRAYKPSPLSTLAPAPPSLSSPESKPFHPFMPSLETPLNHNISNISNPSAIITRKNNKSTPADLTKKPSNADSKSLRSSAQRPKSRLGAAQLRSRPTTSPSTTVITSNPSYSQPTTGAIEFDSISALNFGFNHLLLHPLSDFTAQSSALPPDTRMIATSSSSLLFDPVASVNWQWTPPMPTVSTQPLIITTLGSNLSSQPQSPVPLSHDLSSSKTAMNVPSSSDYFGIQADSSQPSGQFTMNWSALNHIYPLTPATPLPYSEIGTVPSVASIQEYAPASYQWGVGSTTPDSTTWINHDIVYGTDLSTPFLPEVCTPVAIPAPFDNQHQLYSYHKQAISMKQSPSALPSFGSSISVEQDMSISPSLSSCSSSYGSVYSFSEHQHANISSSCLIGGVTVETAISASSNSTNMTSEKVTTTAAKTSPSA